MLFFVAIYVIRLLDHVDFCRAVICTFGTSRLRGDLELTCHSLIYISSKFVQILPTIQQI